MDYRMRESLRGIDLDLAVPVCHVVYQGFLDSDPEKPGLSAEYFREGREFIVAASFEDSWLESSPFILILVKEVVLENSTENGITVGQILGGE